MAEPDLPPTDSEAHPISDSQIQNLFGAAAVTEARTRSHHLWQSPTVETLQSLLPQYEVLSFVARGGMGAVYQAVQRTLHRTVAIKILPPEVIDGEGGDLDYAQRFKQEARAMAKLSHPGIVAVHEAGETSGLLYMVMEFVEGTDVGQMIVSQGKLPVDLAVKIAGRVCEALAYAHAHGVVHRDIKPSNVMVGKNGNVKVADFGLAKLTGHESGGLTRSDMRMGTLDFAAPEALMPGADVDQRADIYAVGVMLYQMLTGKIPRGSFDPPSATVPKLDRRFDAIIEKAMRSDRERRYSSALHMHEALSSIKLPSPAPPAVRKRWRKPAIAGACIGMLLAAAALALVKKPTPTNVPAVQTPKASLTNSLGMKFVPVPGTDVLFCIHETRRQDYAAFAAAVPGVNDDWKHNRAPFGDDHPVSFINLKEAQQFCMWLSQKEGKAYRLPTDHEWSLAVGLDEKAPLTHDSLQAGPLDTMHYPWNGAFPPEARDGNYAGREWLELEARHHPKAELSRCNDGILVTSPVMSFRANPFGLYDMGGNLEELCVFTPDAEGKRTEVLRGAWFYTMTTPGNLLSSCRVWPSYPSVRGGSHGFRVVLEVDAAVTVPVSPAASNVQAASNPPL